MNEWDKDPKTGLYPVRPRAGSNPGFRALKNLARQMATSALRLGMIRRGDHCESCARTIIELRVNFPIELPELEMHHDDYAKPLNVRWLCRRCHVESDKARRLTGDFPSIIQPK